MDPLTLFALANGAVQAVKKGCQLYKDIKSAAGDVKGVIKDLDDQFHKKYDGKSVPPAAAKQLNEEKARVTELNKRSEETTNIYAEIGDYLGQYYDNYFKCLAVLEDEEKRSKTEVYTGGDSLTCADAKATGTNGQGTARINDISKSPGAGCVIH